MAVEATADSDVTKDLFSFVFGPDKRHDAIDDEIILELSSLAGDFAKKVPELKFSTAQIMSYLLKHKNSAEDALKEANDWFGLPPSERQVKSGERKSKESLETPQHSENGLWMKKGNEEEPAVNRIRRTKKFPDLKLIIPASPPPSPCASTPPLSAVGEHVIRTTSVPPDAGAGTGPDIVVQDHCSKNDCNHNAQIRDTDIDFPLNHGARKMTEDDRRELGIQGWGEEKPSCDQLSTSDNGGHHPETKSQDGNGAFHQVGMLKKAIIVTTSIEQTTIPSNGSTVTSKVQTDIKAVRSIDPYDSTSALPSLDLGSLDLICGSHPFDGIGDSPVETTGPASQSALLRAPANPGDGHSARDSDKGRELSISSGIKCPQNIVPVDTFQGMSLGWHMTDAVDGPRGIGLAKTPKQSSCNDAEQTGWVEVVSNILSKEIEG